MLALTSDQSRSALLGALVGDAVGVPYEFHSAGELPIRDALEMTPPPTFPRSHSAVPPGTWSDDGALTLALLDALKSDASLPLDQLGANMLAWYRRGRYAPEGKVFDIGNQTRLSLDAIEAGVDPDLSGPTDEQANGNGSLMRTIACLMVPFDDEESLVMRAMRQSVPTHPHPRSQTACALYALTGWYLSQGGSPEASLAAAQTWLQERLTKPHILELYLILEARDAPNLGSGYVVDTFWSAWRALTETHSYRECIQQAIAFGNDTDTTASIAGGLAGLLYGEVGIPAAWLDALNARERALWLLDGARWSED